MDGQSAISHILRGFCDITPCPGHGALLVDDARSERTVFMFDAAQAQTRTRKSGVESLISLLTSLSDSVNATPAHLQNLSPLVNTAMKEIYSAI